MNLSELIRGGTVCLSKAGLVVAGTTTKAQISAPNGAGVDFAINGILYHVVSADNLVVFTANSQTALYSCIYLVCIDSSNTITTVAGTEVLTANITSGKTPLTWPVPTEDTCPIGAIKIVATSAFTAGTTALGTGNAVTYYDLFAVPDTPIVS